MMQVKAKNLFSWDFILRQDETELTTVNLKRFRVQGRFECQGAAFELQREGSFSGDFLLRRGEDTLARATKESTFSRTFNVVCGKRSYVLKPRSMWRREFLLLENDGEVGRVSPCGLFFRRGTVELPGELTLPVQIFIVWLVWIMWRRRTHSHTANHG